MARHNKNKDSVQAESAGLPPVIPPVADFADAVAKTAVSLQNNLDALSPTESNPDAAKDLAPPEVKESAPPSDKSEYHETMPKVENVAELSAHPKFSKFKGEK